LYQFFLSSVGAETSRSFSGVYAPDDPKVSAPTKLGVNTDNAGCETRVSTARFCCVAILVSPPASYLLFLSSVRAETWRSSGGVYAPEDPKVLAPTKLGVNTEGMVYGSDVIVLLYFSFYFLVSLS
jgi:hypothetical protein